jgi:gamma-glutamyl hercynylcysteine S-oxide synthase
MPSGTASWGLEGTQHSAPGAARQAGRDALSLALIDSRNQLLAALALNQHRRALQRAAQAAHFQEWWIARHVQRTRGEHGDASAMRLPSIEPAAEAWASGQHPPPPERLREYLRNSLELTLELLAGSDDSDNDLYFYRLALLHEDRLVESLRQHAAPEAAAPAAAREPLWLPAQRFAMGSAPGGLVPHGERWAHEVVLPETEIDAQPVSWAQFTEFAQDGGYDRADLWSPAGWSWVQAEQRRAPRGVEQLAGGVLLARDEVSLSPASAETRAEGPGHLRRASPHQAATGLSRFEAEAWCTWAGRRLPTEPEWELAACTAAPRGFVWGTVREWVAGSARAWPGITAPPPGELEPLPRQPGYFVQRGSSAALPRRSQHPRARHFALASDDRMDLGFRSCAL